MLRWTDNTIKLIDRNDTGLRVQRVLFAGDGAATEFDLPHLNTKAHIVWVDGSPVSSYDYSVEAEGGESGGDRLTFDTAPADGAVILVRYSWQGSPRGAFSSTRRPIELLATEDDRYMVATGREALWQIAGRPDVYGDPTMWWVLVDVNESLNSVFQAQFDAVPAGTVLRIPAKSKVVDALEL